MDNNINNFNQNADQQNFAQQNTQSQDAYQQNAYQQNAYQQPTYQQNAYQQNPYQNGYNNMPAPANNGEPVSIGQWMLTMLIMMIPIANIIMMFVWAFGSDVPASKKNFFRAQLIWAVIWIVLLIVLYAMGLATFFATINY
jgi:competence CoiA-like predicted nuclease